MCFEENVPDIMQTKINKNMLRLFVCANPILIRKQKYTQRI